MLTEEQIELLGQQLVPLYQELEQEVIADIARRVKKTGRYTETAEIMVKSLMEKGYSPEKIQKEVMKLIRAEKDYQMAVAENTKEYKDMISAEIKRIVAEAKEQGNEIVAQAGNMAYNNDLSMWKQAGKSLTQPSSFNQLVNAMALQTNKELRNLTRSLGFKNVGFTALENVYQHQLDLGLIKLTSGAYSWQQVVDDCVRELAQSGLRTIDYESGKSMQLDTAVRNCIRTSSARLSGKVTMLNLEETGGGLVEVSSHWGARSDGSCGHSDHAYWQGKVYAVDHAKHRSESKRLGYTIRNLEEVTGYPSDPRGLLGYNCRHMMYPFWEGISEPNKWDPEPEPVTVNGREYDYYHATQRQRQMERQIRATKREIEAQRIIGGDTTELNAKLKKQMAQYKQFSADVNIRPKNERLRVQSGSSSLRPRKKKDAENQERIGRTQKELEESAKQMKVTVSDYSDKDSKWSGKLIVNNSECDAEHANGIKNWDCSILIRDDVEDGTILHEMLHSCSISYYDVDMYMKVLKTEEAAVELLTQEICSELGLKHNPAYENYVTVLRTLNYSLSICETDMEFAKMFFNIPANRRFTWLQNKVSDYIIKNKVPVRDAGEIMDFLNILEDIDR